MDIRKVKKLIELIEQSGMNEIEIHEGEESVRIARHSNTPLATTPTAGPVSVPTTTSVPTIETQEHATQKHLITSPMVGTFYSCASPTSEAFVKVGQRINQGDTICIIEAMKIMNKIEADQAGVVTEILCSDGDAVEFGQALIAIQ